MEQMMRMGQYGYAQVCEHIVIPNIRLRDDMEEMFEMNWLEYVRRDTEGSDNDTRRRAATDLVKALTARFEAQVGLESGNGFYLSTLLLATEILVYTWAGRQAGRPPSIMHANLTLRYSRQQRRYTAWAWKGRFLVTVRDVNCQDAGRFKDVQLVGVWSPA